MQVCQVSASSSLLFLRRRILKNFRKFTLMSPRQPIKLSDLDKSRMKHGGLLNIYFCKKKNSNIPNDLAEFVNFHFSHYKSMGTISCHSNQSSYPTGIKKTIYVEANVQSMYAKFRLHSCMVSEKKIFKHFYENRLFLPPRQPIKFTNLDKSHMKRRGLLN